MSRYRFSFVILHYVTIDDTIRCIESIQNLNFDNMDYDITIVDNGSANGTGEKLVKKYKNNSRIKVLLSKENLGFAKGNNLGFVYAKKAFSPDFIILCNNDTQIITPDFPKKVVAAYEEEKFAVMGPKENLVEGGLYPYSEPLEIKDVKKNIRVLRERLYFPILAFVRAAIFEKKKKIRVGQKNHIDLGKLKKNVVLHGAFLIFSKIYIDKFDGLNERTFMYCEEDLLMLRLKKNGMTSLYNPDIEILHGRGSSTKKTSGGNKRAITRLIVKRQLESLKILLDEMRQ